MSNLGKRPNSWVDLTGSEDENPAPQRKQARVNASSNRVAGSSSQPPPSQSLSSSNPSSQCNSYAFPSTQGGEDAANDIIDLSQDRDEGFGWVCLGVIEDKIVGVRYYHGYATPGEQVMIMREPGNPYDSNAIRINNVQGIQIGHIPKNLAAKLAPFLVSTCIHPNFPRILLMRNRTQELSYLKVSLLERRVLGIVPSVSESLVHLSQMLVLNLKPR